MNNKTILTKEGALELKGFNADKFTLAEETQFTSMGSPAQLTVGYSPLKNGEYKLKMRSPNDPGGYTVIGITNNLDINGD